MARKTQKYSIVIHTDSYAGNFERELRGYVTGCRGEWDRANFESEIRTAFAGDPDCDWEELDEDENPFADLWKLVAGQYGFRIEELAQTPKEFSPKGDLNSVRLHCKKKPTAKQLKLVKEWAYKFAERSKCVKPVDRYNHFQMKTPSDPFWFVEPINILGFTLECDEVKTVHTKEDF